jgi:hypothetical protein
MRVARNDYEWIWLVTNQPKASTMQLNPYLLCNRQCAAAFKFKDRRLIPNRVFATGNYPL